MTTRAKRPRPAAKKKAAARAAPRKAAAARRVRAARPAAGASKTPAAVRRKKTASKASRAAKSPALTQREKQATQEEMERYADAGMSLSPDELRWWVGLEALVIGGRTGIERLSRATRYSTGEIRAIIEELRAVVQQKGDSAAFQASLREARQLRKNHRKRWASLN